ncbi:hypothetical protein [Streptomyces sp. NPDC096132]|uniref:hypothetical protein n=1 Tax=Streptomyces sp. NPDC096132 TaxID=3366075 RepID=UPI003812A2A0
MAAVPEDTVCGPDVGQGAFARCGFAAVPSADGPMAALRSLADHPWAMEPEGTTARHWAIALCRGAGFEPDVRSGPPT